MKLGMQNCEVIFRPCLFLSKNFISIIKIILAIRRRFAIQSRDEYSRAEPTRISKHALNTVVTLEAVLQKKKKKKKGKRKKKNQAFCQRFIRRREICNTRACIQRKHSHYTTIVKTRDE